MAATEPEIARPDSLVDLPLSMGVVERNLQLAINGLPQQRHLTLASVDNTAWQLEGLVKHSRVSEKWLAHHGFVANKSALTNLSKPLDGHSIAGVSNAYVLTMAPSPNVMQFPELEMARISEEERYVQTALPLKEIYSYDSVVVRWRNLDNGSVQELSPQKLATGVAATSLALWMYKPEAWPVGHYMVEIVSGSVNLHLIATGQFAIVPHGAQITPQTYLVTNQAVQSESPRVLAQEQ